MIKKINIKSFIKKITIKTELRKYSIIIIAFITLISILNTIVAYQSPISKEEITPLINYFHNGKYNYMVYLKNNSLYDTNILFTTGEIYFKNIIEKLNISYNYIFNTDQYANINGTYHINAQLSNNLWSKNFTIIPQTNFNNDAKQVLFTTTFPLNIIKYDDFIEQVNNETDTTPQDSTLYISTLVNIQANTINTSIKDEFTHTIEIPWKKNTIEINRNLTINKNGNLVNTTYLELQSVKDSRLTWSTISIILGIILILFIIITEYDTKYDEIKLNQVKKIKKKYGEWIIELDNNTPKVRQFQNTNTVKNIDDLVKLSEELGKPIISFRTEDNEYIYYVYDHPILYLFSI
jgi:hypothetical protein